MADTPPAAPPFETGTPAASAAAPPRPAPVAYRTRRVAAAPPARFAGLLPTDFRVAERSAGSDALFIFPGFGVSVRQIGADALLWERAPRYRLLVTLDAVNYPTSVDYLLWQCAQLLRELPDSPLYLLGLSLGGSTAVQLLFRLLREDPPLYQRARRLVTLIAPVLLRDFNPRWQGLIRLMSELCDAGQPREGVSRRIRATALRVVARAIQPRLRRSCLEVDDWSEIVASFTHMADTYRLDPSDAPLGGLPDLDIVSVGTEGDDMVIESRVHRYGARPGRHVVVRGRHTPDFYEHSRDLYDHLLLAELGQQPAL